MSSLRGKFDPRIGIIVRIGIARPNSFSSQETRPVPPIVKVKALLDTGASNTSIKATVAESLKLPPLGRRPTHSIHGEQSTNWYDGDILLYWDDSPNESYLASEIQLVELQEKASVDALLGRDVLCEFDFRMTKAHEFVLSL